MVHPAMRGIVRKTRGISKQNFGRSLAFPRRERPRSAKHQLPKNRGRREVTGILYHRYREEGFDAGRETPPTPLTYDYHTKRKRLSIEPLERHMGEVIQFVSKYDRERIRLIREARARYESVFPSADVVNDQHSAVADADVREGR